VDRALINKLASTRPTSHIKPPSVESRQYSAARRRVAGSVIHSRIMRQNHMVRAPSVQTIDRVAMLRQQQTSNS